MKMPLNASIYVVIFLPVLHYAQLSTENTILEYLQLNHLYPLTNAEHFMEVL